MVSWIPRLFSWSASRSFPAPSKVKRTARPRLEPLEDRVTPTTYTVTSINDSGVGSLRYEVGLAGTGDTVNFSSALNNRTIVLQTEIGLGVDSNGDLNGVTNLTIDGGSVNVTVSGNNATRIFEVFAGSDTINNLTLTNGKAVLMSPVPRARH